MKAGDKFGDFELVEPIAEGGNAFVWQARRDEFGVVALKILKTRNVQAEPYRRFRQEVETLERVGDRPGVLPLLAADVPERLSARRRAWFSMPIAEPLDEALREAPLEDIIESAASIAETLAALLAEFGLSHRDIKPRNLYRFDGRAAVGDFGLVALPDAEHLTRSDKPLGPTNFIPYEMLVDPANADAAAADVYSFGKTLWVLISGQRWPPPGEQAAANEAISLRNYRAHPRLRLLDELIERCTKHRPEDRPTMSQVAADLRAWRAMKGEQEDVPDLSEYGRRLRSLAAPRLNEAARERRLEEIAGELSDRLANLLKPMDSALREEYPLTETDVAEEWVENMLAYHEHFGSARILAHEGRATRLPGGGTIPLVLTIGRYVGVTDDGLTHIAGMIDLGYERVIGSHEGWESERVSVAADSLEAQEAIEALARELHRRAPYWLGRFVSVLGGESELGQPPLEPPEPNRPMSDAERAAHREEHAREIDRRIGDFLFKMRGIDQPFYVGDLVAAVNDPKFDERAAHGVLARLVESGRVETQRTASGDEYWSV